MNDERDFGVIEELYDRESRESNSYRFHTEEGLSRKRILGSPVWTHNSERAPLYIADSTSNAVIYRIQERLTLQSYSQLGFPLKLTYGIIYKRLRVSVSS